MVRTMDDQHSAIFRQLRPTTARPEMSLDEFGRRDVGEGVAQPRAPCAEILTSTRVVSVQLNVPSASGDWVGTV